MHHSDVAYSRDLRSLPAGNPALPSPRVCRLFQCWREKPRWLTAEEVGHLFKNLDASWSECQKLEVESRVVRKGLAVRRMLAIVVDDSVAASAGNCEIDPDELIVGTMPSLSVGQGKEFVGYLAEDEALGEMFEYLNEISPMGHIVPDHSRVVKKGLGELIQDCRDKAQSAVEAGNGPSHAAERDFYRSVADSLQGLIAKATSLNRWKEVSLEHGAPIL